VVVQEIPQHGSGRVCQGNAFAFLFHGFNLSGQRIKDTPQTKDDGIGRTPWI
jgi:hypothetical protein